MVFSIVIFERVFYYNTQEKKPQAPNCITGNVTKGSIVASGKMLLSDRQKSQSEEPHDEPEKQARTVGSGATQIPESGQG
jgi:hypothetical protein